MLGPGSVGTVTYFTDNSSRPRPGSQEARSVSGPGAPAPGVEPFRRSRSEWGRCQKKHALRRPVLAWRVRTNG